MKNITAIILTFNEELNIEKCILSVKEFVDRIIVVDSGSTDKTIEIAQKLGAEIYRNMPFINYAKQFNWALDNTDIKTKWVYRIDADEIVTTELGKEIIEACSTHENDEVNGFIMKFRINFLGKFLRYGGMYPFYNLTIFKYGIGRYEDRHLGEHVVLKYGKTKTLKNDCLHYDFKSLTNWIQKHNLYSSREVKDRMATINNQQLNATLYNHAEITKKLRDGLYYKLPKFYRAKLYFIYRYYIKLGFLDGTQGKIYAFLQAYWYRYLVDAKIFENEIKRNYESEH